jgi:hypothetical protein
MPEDAETLSMLEVLLLALLSEGPQTLEELALGVPALPEKE